MPNKMLIDASHPEETRVVVVRGNRIEEFDFESQDKKQLRGNIYLARVTRVEPSLQAAFVEYGGNRHGFLAFSEIHPDYYQIPVADRQALLRAEADEARAEDDDDDDTNGGDHQERSRGRRKRRGRGRHADSGHASGAGEQETTDESTADDPDVVDAASTDDGPTAAGDEGATPVSPASAETDQADNGAVESGENENRDSSGRSMAAAIDGDVISEPAPVVSGDDQANGGGVEEIRNGSTEEVESVGAEDALEEVRARRKPLRRQYKIQEVIKRRQILLVQVVKEERGNKGAALTTYLSLAGRYSVLMPNTARGGGISRKITNLQDRKRLKEVVKDLDVPDGMGVILRTAGENRTKAEIKRDYEYLMRLWENVRSLTLRSTAPALVYEEGSLIKRSVRDLYNKDIDEILVAGEEGYREAKDFMRMLMPSHAKVVQPYRETTPIFARNGIEAQLDRMLQPQVTLKSGGYIIINQTEALVSIDVNSGRSTKEHSIEDTALQTNLEAAEEVARQLRLRDLAGLIVIDFIDMEENRNNRAVEKKLKDCLKNDRARIQVGRISHFGLMEMSRQRIRASVLESTMKPCPHCGGTGHIRSDSSVALLVVRAIEEFLLKDSRNHITVRTPSATALYVLNHKRSTLVDMERRFGVTITVEADETLGSQHYSIGRGAVAEKPAGFIEPASLPVATYAEPEDLEEETAEILDDEDETETGARDQRAEHQNGQHAQDGEHHRDRKRRRRRRRRGGRDRGDEAHHRSDEDVASAAHGEAANDDQPVPEEALTADAAASEVQETLDSERKKRRRGKRGGKRNRREEDAGLSEDTAEADGTDNAQADAAAEPESTDEAQVEAHEPVVGAVEVPAGETGQSPDAPAASVEEAAPVKPRRGSRQRKAATAETGDAVAETAAKPARKPRSPRKKADTPEATESAAALTAPGEVTAEALDRAAAETEVEPMAPANSDKSPEPEIASTPASVDEAAAAPEPREEPKPKKAGWWQRSKSFF